MTTTQTPDTDRMPPTTPGGSAGRPNPYGQSPSAVPGSDESRPQWQGATAGETQQDNYLASILGAALGAGGGALIWFGIAYMSGMEFGIIAALVGAMSGWGAAKVGKVRSETVGYIAAVVGLVGMFVGSYAGYHCGIHRELEKAQLQQDFYYSQDVENPGWYRMSAEAKQAAFDDYYAGIAAQDPGYIAGMMGDPWGLLMTVVFGGVGIYYAYRVGSGQGGQSSVWS